MRSWLLAWSFGTELGTRVGIAFRSTKGTELGLEFYWLRNGNEPGLLRRSGRILWRMLKVAATLLALWAALRTLGLA